jgi:dihydroorotase
MKNYYIKGATLVNENRKFPADVAIKNGLIEKIVLPTDDFDTDGYIIIDGTGRMLIPGAIDDQVHFREPGLTHKGEIYTEARAGVAGGVTSYMEMPNTKPGTITAELLEEKYKRAAEVSLGNYSFYMGTTNENLQEILKVDYTKVCGVKIFMGSSTGNMLVDKMDTIEELFKNVKVIIASHCEDDPMIAQNLEKYKAEYGENIPVEMHPKIRSAEACYASSSKAIELAKKHGARFHVLHISTGIETELFTNKIPLKEKKITSEACIHHLWFSDEDYKEKGSLIKWNPAVKTAGDRDKIWEALLDDRIDVIATDHAPHTLEEKALPYTSCPSGGPLIQHSVVAMFEFWHRGKITMEKIVQKMCHNVADLFEIDKRGYIREGYHADLVLIDHDTKWTVTKENLFYKCGWSPFEGTTFHSAIEKTFVSGHLVYDKGKFDESIKGKRLEFNRP